MSRTDSELHVEVLRMVQGLRRELVPLPASGVVPLEVAGANQLPALFTNGHLKPVSRGLYLRFVAPSECQITQPASISYVQLDDPT